MKEIIVDDATKTLLRLYAQRYETVEFLNGDPSWYMHQVEGDRNRESMAFVASCLSYGSRTQFMPKIGQLLEWSGGDMDLWIRSGGYRQHFSPDDKNCFYRLYNKECIFRFFEAYRKMLVDYGSMGEYVRNCASDGFHAVEAVCAFFSSKRVGAVVPKDTMSACKRVCMFLRWMVRDNSPVDLGIWADFIDRRTLIMPLDTHVVSQSIRLGLLSSGSASMNAARRLTSTMSLVFPNDPLKGDFALFGYGINESKES